MELYRREGKERKGEERSSSPLTTVSILLPFVKQCTAQTLSASPEKRRKIAFFFLTVTRAGGMADRLGRRRRGPSARRKDRELVVEKLSDSRACLFIAGKALGGRLLISSLNCSDKRSAEAIKSLVLG